MYSLFSKEKREKEIYEKKVKDIKEKISSKLIK